MSDDTEVGILTRTNPFADALGADILGELAAVDRRLVTGRYGNYEPLRKLLRPDDLAEALGAWADPFLWSNRRAGVSGRVREGTPSSHSSILLTADSGRIDVSALRELVSRLACRLSAHFAYLHVYSEEELRDESRRALVGPFRVFVSTADLEKGIPELSAFQVFGSPYVEMFGRERLLGAPCHAAEELEGGLVSLQLTPNLDASMVDYAALNTARESVKGHLGPEAFWDPDGGSGSMAPDFGLIENLRAKAVADNWAKILE